MSASLPARPRAANWPNGLAERPMWRPRAFRYADAVENTKDRDHAGKRNARPHRCSWASTEAMTHYHDTEWGVPVPRRSPSVRDARAGRRAGRVCRGRRSSTSARAIGRCSTASTSTEVAAFTRRRRRPPDGATPASCATAPRSSRRFSTPARSSASRRSTARSRTSCGRSSATRPSTRRAHPTSRRRRPRRNPDALSRALKQYGCKFVGTTICYAFMQATGMVNDHEADCLCRARRKPPARHGSARKPENRRHEAN